MTGRPNVYSNDRPRYVYICVDSFGNALYVGSSIHPKARLEQHRYATSWWPYVADMAAIGPFDRDTALEIEREFIWELRPWFNTKGVPVLEVAS